MAETTFGVKYKGPALEDGRMPVRELAPALLALGDLFREASKEIYPDLSPPTLEVKATEKGSFDVHLVLAADGMWDQVVNMLTAQGPTALTNLTGLIIDGSVIGGGLLKLIEMINNRRIKAEEPGKEPERTRIILEDDTTIEVPAGTVRLYRKPSIRRAAKDSVAPLRSPDIEAVDFEPPDAEPTTIEASAVRAFDLPPDDEDDGIVSEQEINVFLDVLTAELEAGSTRKWRFGGLGETFLATIEDPAFMEKVAQHEEVFGAGDQLEGTLQIIQRRDSNTGKIRAERRVIRVNRVIKADEQLQLGESAERDGGDDGAGAVSA